MLCKSLKHPETGKITRVRGEATINALLREGWQETVEAIDRPKRDRRKNRTSNLYWSDYGFRG